MIGIAAKAGDGAVIFVVHRRLVIQGQVTKAAIAAGMLGGEAELAGAVLVAPVDLPAVISAHPALAVRGIHHAKTPQLDHRPRTGERQFLRAFGVPLQRQPVRQAVAIRSAPRRRAVVKILNAVVAPQAPQGNGPVAKPFFQQIAGDVKRQRGTHLAPQRIGGDQHRIPGAVNVGQVRQGERSGLQLRGPGAVAVNEEVDRGRHRRFT